MPAPSAILDRPEFQILRRLSVDQLRRINPETARRRARRGCPLGQALRTEIPDGLEVEAYLCGPFGHDEDIYVAAKEFIETWDDEDTRDQMSRADLAAAVAVAIAEKEGADARP